MNSNTSQINPQEIFLLERYTSLAYFGQLRDTWQAMISHVEAQLSLFMTALPLDYRSRPLPNQPDVVWGERVLPNFRKTFSNLCDGYIKLSHGDVSGLRYASGPISDFKGEEDFWADWMGEEGVTIYRKLLGTALTLARNIVATESAQWDSRQLTALYDPVSRGPLDAPDTWPAYALDRSVQVKSGDPIPLDGIYLPDETNSSAQFLSMYYEDSPSCSIFLGMQELLHPVTAKKYGEEARFGSCPCTWTLVKRISDSSSRKTAPNLLSPVRLRVAGGERCPEDGYYFTPAQMNSRRKFKQGEIMPSLQAQYGATIWQWDANQD